MFVRTVEAGSITGAAKVLDIDKSAVSRRLKSLEARLGATLLNRSTRTLSLTEAGRAYHARAQELLRAWRDMEDEASGAESALAGPVRIAAPLSFGLSQLGPVLIDFQHDNPGIRLDIDFSDRKVDLVAEGFDLAVRIGRLDDSALIARKLGSVTMLCVASPDWLEAHGPINAVEDLRDKPELRYGLIRGLSPTYKGPDGKMGAVQSDPIMKASNGDFLRDAAIRGAGMTIQPDFIVCDAVRSGALMPFLTEYEFDAPSVYAVWSPKRHMPRRVRTLVNYLVEKFGGEAPWSVDAYLGR